MSKSFRFPQREMLTKTITLKEVLNLYRSKNEKRITLIVAKFTLNGNEEV